MNTNPLALPFALDQDYPRTIVNVDRIAILATYPTPDGTTDKALAAFIVTACNAHDGLVDALLGCINAFTISERNAANRAAKAVLKAAGVA